MVLWKKISVGIKGCYKKQPYETHGYVNWREIVFITVYEVISVKTQEGHVSLVSLPVNTYIIIINILQAAGLFLYNEF